MRTPDDAFAHVSRWRARREAAGRLLVALDFDGTIAPIVLDPAEAEMLPGARAAIDALSQRRDTEIAFISGRSLQDLQIRCGYGEAYYAGNHGIEIQGPQIEMLHPQALACKDEVQRFGAALRPGLAEAPGVYLEDKHLSLSVHYRNVEAEAERRRIVSLIEAKFAELGSDSIRLTYGKRVVEVRPDIEWNKGQALTFLKAELSARYGAEMPVVFIGDDQTDEDGFKALAGDGTVRVADRPCETAAATFVRTTQDVVRLLEELA
jgi:trehalose 6-phosphate phosphatase